MPNEAGYYNEVFYIGKGKGDRAHHSAIKKHNQRPNDKEARIKDIQSSGHAVKVHIIQRFVDYGTQRI